MNDFVVVIPARYASTRLPGKVLRPIAGKPMLQHVHERACESAASSVTIATDDRRVAAAATRFGARVCMTAGTHVSGTERVAEVVRRQGLAGDAAVVNLQGDEPLMPPEVIDQCAALLDEGDADIATLASPFATRAEFEDPNLVKAIVDDRGRALYFSRAPLPRPREPEAAALALQTALHHHGIYAYRARVLQDLVQAAPSPLERCEQLEQLRALAMGLSIRVGVAVRRPGAGVDTEADLARVEAILRDGGGRSAG